MHWDGFIGCLGSFQVSSLRPRDVRPRLVPPDTHLSLLPLNLCQYFFFFFYVHQLCPGGCRLCTVIFPQSPYPFHFTVHTSICSTSPPGLHISPLFISLASSSGSLPRLAALVLQRPGLGVGHLQRLWGIWVAYQGPTSSASQMMFHGVPGLWGIRMLSCSHKCHSLCLGD